MKKTAKPKVKLKAIPKKAIIKITDKSFTDEGAKEVIVKLGKFNRRNTGVVWLEICSNGGNIRALRAIWDMLDTCNFKINTIAYGSVYSCAALLFLRGEERLIYRSAELILHEPRIILEKDMELICSDLIQITSKLKKDCDWCIEQVKKHCTLPEKKIKNKIKEEWVLDSSEALETGIATQIVSSVEI